MMRSNFKHHKIYEEGSKALCDCAWCLGRRRRKEIIAAAVLFVIPAIWGFWLYVI